MGPFSPMGALQRYGGAVHSALWGHCSAMGAPFAQPYRGRCSLSPIGALRRYGGAAALWGTQSYRGRCSLSPMGALQPYGGAQPYRGRCSLSPIGGAAALWGGAGPNLWGRKAAPRMCGAAGGAHSAVPRRADVAVAVPAALRAPTVGDVITQ